MKTFSNMSYPDLQLTKEAYLYMHQLILPKMMDFNPLSKEYKELKLKSMRVAELIDAINEQMDSLP